MIDLIDNTSGKGIFVLFTSEGIMYIILGQDYVFWEAFYQVAIVW